MVKSTVESSTNAQGYGLKLSFCHRSSHLIRGGQVVTFHHNSMGIQWGLHVKDPGINITWDISIYLSIYIYIYTYLICIHNLYTLYNQRHPIDPWPIQTRLWWVALQPWQWASFRLSWRCDALRLMDFLWDICFSSVITISSWGNFPTKQMSCNP